MPDDAGAAIEVTGGDADLAAAAAAAPEGALLRFLPTPESDFARVLGLGAGGGPGHTVVACDLLDLGRGHLAVNAAVMGVAPDRLRFRHRSHRVVVQVDGREVFRGAATTVVVAVGQFLRGTNLVPRGHPGDGRAEIQVYALDRGERRPLRLHLARGDHLPNPRITQTSGHQVVVRWAGRRAPLEVDGRAGTPAEEVEIQVRSAALRVLI